MKPTRREFLWTLGAAGSTLMLQESRDVFWAPEEKPDLGWSPGIESVRNSTCLICPGRCGVRGRLVDGRLVRLTGNTRHPMSRGGLCPRGVAGVQVTYHPERLAGPLVRSGERGAGKWQPVSRAEALGQIVERLQSLRTNGQPERLAVLAGYCAGSMRDLWGQFLRAFGTPNYIADDYDDGTEAIMSLMHGFERRPGYDLAQSRLVLSFGAPLFESWWSPLQAFVAYGRADGEDSDRPRFVQVDTRFSRTAARAQEWVGIKAGTHAALALGIAYVLIRDGLIDERFLARHVNGFEDFTDRHGRRREGYRSLVMRNYRTEEVSRTTGVSVERITALARSFARNAPAVAVLGSDVMLSSNGLLAGLAVHSLNVLTGNIGQPGGVLVGASPPLAPLPEVIEDAISTAGQAHDPVSGTPPLFANGDPASRFAHAVAAGSTQPIDVLLTYYANPLASSVHPDVWRDAIDRIPFIVSFSPFLDETTRHADVILPDLLPYERWQDAPTPPSYPFAVWGMTQPLVEPPGGGTHTGDAVLALATELGGSIAQSLPYESFQALLRARARGLFAAGRGVTFGTEFERSHHLQMESRGWWLAEHEDFESFWDGLVTNGGWMDLFYDHMDPVNISQAPSGRVELMPPALLRALEERNRGDALYVEVTAGDHAAPTDFPLRLIPYRLSTLASGTLTLARWLAEQPTIFPDVQWTPWIEVNPNTARHLGLSDNTMVWVVSERGRLRARLNVFPGAANDTVCMPYGQRHPEGEGANPLQLTDGSHDPLTGLPAWFSSFVRLERA